MADLALRRSRVFIQAAIITLISIGNFSPTFSQSCDCEVSDRKEKSYDNLLFLNDEEKKEAEAIHLPWGIPAPSPTATNENLLHQQDYIVNYDGDLSVPVWVAYRLTRGDVNIRRERLECFRRDPRLDTAVASFCEDYEEPIFDRGHMVPSADMTRSEAAMINTYMFSNMAPQYGAFNRGIWAYLEPEFES